MIEKPVIENAPGLVWRQRRSTWTAEWHARTDLVRRGYTPKHVKLWDGEDLSQVDRDALSDRCQILQGEMLIWGRGGLPTIGAFDGTLRELINSYQTDKDSTYRKLRYRVRLNQDGLVRRIAADYGSTELRNIKARLLISWHDKWMEGGRVAMAHAFVGALRTLVGFGATILEDAECERLCGLLHKMRFPMARPRTERMTAEQAVAVREKAHKCGLHSIALAQALQFELMLRQKDVIGEWVPTTEPGTSDVIHGNLKWIIGLRWSEIDSNLILRHTTSKRKKDIEVDLKLAPMVMEELRFLQERGHTSMRGPMIVSEQTAKPYSNIAFRQRWRMVADAAGLPKAVKNMDSRAGGITEATDAGASLEMVRHAATHSNVSTTANYSRGSTEKTADVMRLRGVHRNKNTSGT